MSQPRAAVASCAETARLLLATIAIWSFRIPALWLDRGGGRGAAVMRALWLDRGGGLDAAVVRATQLIQRLPVLAPDLLPQTIEAIWAARPRGDLARAPNP